MNLVPHFLDASVQPVMSVSEAAEVLHISRGSAYQAVQAGEIPSIRLGRRLVIPTAALARMLDLGEPDLPEPA